MDDPFAEPSNTRQAILGAAFRALCEHGYANVTIQRIGDEFDKSPSLVYHHYDGKDDLLLDLLGFLLDQFEASVADGSLAERSDDAAAGAGDDVPEIAPEAFDRSARDQLDDYLTAVVDPASLDDPYAPDERFVTVMTELRAQAASDEAYRDHFDRSDRVFGEYLERLVREAAAEADDRPPGPDDDSPGPDPNSVDAAEVAATLQTFATGGMFRWATTNGGPWVAGSRAGIDRYIEVMLPLVDASGAGE
ncbi:TetR family transcriptional regulator [Halorubrum sp. Atlit-8R]|uniref:TetR/AcrR family transcriptional regulator n=1 Tax=unclassified Halorubrum TaxID=2642239 RepID=UPI000EF1ADC8|nr:MULTISPECIES: TetR family transcriptional regulator [unclassified Halorubrum]RLM70916.1 TetR family transcriptional regulator [Halorubrum sp. Atlit-9R]RLM71784.1 TetR family transcriptional regulator [Halorubrum sp. Atlit-9R]RLM82931.1 TetR family transcriptional regulator [Halorubrum sp. Atlit-8R]